MSLFDSIRAAAKLVDPQFQVSSNEIPGVISAIGAYLEHGDAFLQAAEKGPEELHNLLAPPPPEDETPAPATAAAPADLSNLSDEQLAALVSDLQGVVASRRATSQQTTVEHQTGAGPSET